MWERPSNSLLLYDIYITSLGELVTQTPVATIVRSHGYKQLSWLRFVDIIADVSNVSLAINTVFLVTYSV
jgi:hypothetical protein